MHNVVKSFYCPAMFRPRSFARGLRVLFGDQAMFCRARDFAYVGGFDEALPIMEDADLCVRMHVAGPSADGDDANASVALTTPLPACEDFGKWRLEAGKAGEPPTYRREDVRPEGRRRGRVVLVNRLVTTSGRRVEGLGNAKATAVHFLIGLGWYFGADPDAMVRLYRRFYADVR